MYSEVPVYYSYLAGQPIAILPTAPGSAIDKQCCLCIHDGEIAPLVMVEPLLIVLEVHPEVPVGFKETVGRILLNPLKEITFEEMKQLNLERELKWSETHYA